MSGRKQISTRMRFEIFKRDGFTCQYCGATPPGVVLHVDHIIPVADGGENHPHNLTTACSTCNLGKSDISLSVIPRSLEEASWDAEERRAQVEAYAAALQEEREAFEDDCWSVAEILKSGASNGYAASNFRSITMFVRRLGKGPVIEAANIAADRWGEGSRRFKYFCGVCWRMVREAEGEE